MTSANDRLVLAASLIAESAWLYALFGILGLWFQAGGSPLVWPAVLVPLGASLVVARTLNLIAMPMVVASSIQMLVGAVVLYLTLGTQIPTSTGGIDLGWIGDTTMVEDGADNPRWAVLASAFAVTVWWRGGRLAASDFPVETLATSFRLGVLALSLSIIVDIASPTNLNVLPMMFIFFAAGLAGLSIGNLLPAFEATSEGRTWPRVIAGVVAAVLIVGLAFSLLQERVISAVTAPAVWLLKGLGTVAFYVALPFVYVASLLASWIFALLRMLSGDRETEQDALSPPVGFEFLEREQGATPGYVEIIGWGILAVVVVAALIVLARAFRRRKRWRLVQPEVLRESLRDDVDVWQDLAQLLLNLLPDRFKRRGQTGHFKLPDGDPDIVDVFRIYFGLLVMAEERGFARPPTETPAEYQSTLEELFPRALVRSVTAAFVRACYGNHPAPRQQIDEMRLSVERLATEVE